MKKFKEENLKEIINYQMDLNWYKERFEDLQKIDDWFVKFETTETLQTEYVEYLTKYLKDYVPKFRLRKEVWGIILQFWLKIENEK